MQHILLKVQNKEDSRNNPNGIYEQNLLTQEVYPIQKIMQVFLYFFDFFKILENK